MVLLKKGRDPELVEGSEDHGEHGRTVVNSSFQNNGKRNRENNALLR